MTTMNDERELRYIVNFTHPSHPPGQMGHTSLSTFDTRHEAVGWMANRMRENPNTGYRLDVYDRSTGERVRKGTAKRDGSEMRYPPGVPTPADTVVDTSTGRYITRMGHPPIPVSDATEK